VTWHAQKKVEQLEAEIEQLRQELVECRDQLEHAERKLAGEWPYAAPAPSVVEREANPTVHGGRVIGNEANPSVAPEGATDDD